jgi:hypothetical protein
MKKSELKQIIKEEISKILNKVEYFEKKLKQYLDTDVHSSGNISLSSVFGDQDIDTLIKSNPDKFKIPTKYTPANMYFWRGFALPIEKIKKLGPFKNKESLKGSEYLVSYDKNFTNDGIQSFTAFEKVAIGFSEYSSGYVDEESFDPKIDEIPVLLGVEYSKYKDNFFGNPEYFAKIGKHGNEGETFYKGGTYKADVFIPSYIEKYLTPNN